jgi:hypothetical protein
MYDQLYGIINNGYLLTNKKAMDQWSNTLRRIILDTQDNAITGADVAAIAFLRLNRKFILNPTGADITIPYNGKDRIFGFLQSHSMHPDEWDFFMDKIREQNLALVDDPNGTAYFTGSGTLQFYYF